MTLREKIRAWLRNTNPKSFTYSDVRIALKLKSNSELGNLTQCLWLMTYDKELKVLNSQAIVHAKPSRRGRTAIGPHRIYTVLNLQSKTLRQIYDRPHIPNLCYRG